MGAADGAGAPAGVARDPISREDPQGTEYASADGRPGGAGGAQAGAEGCHPQSPANSGAVCELHIRSAEEGWIPEASGEPQAVEPVRSEAALQDGGDSAGQGPLEEGGLYGVHRPEGRLPVGADPRRAQEVPSFSVEVPALRISGSPLRTVERSPHLHQTIEASNGSPEAEGAQVGHFHRRPSADGAVGERVGTEHPGGGDVAQGPRVCDQLGEVLPDPEADHGVFGVPHQLPEDDSEPTGSQGEADSGGVPGDPPERERVCQRIGQADRQDVSGITGEIVAECRGTLQRESVSVRELARLIGRMSAASQAVLPAPLRFRSLQRAKNKAFRRTQSFETVVNLNQEIKTELTWWAEELSKWNGRKLSLDQPSLVIETDASLLGWGAALGEVSTGGLWTERERLNHIHLLELIGGAFAIQTFARGLRDAHVRLRMDNTTAISYINRMGGTRSLDLARSALDL